MSFLQPLGLLVAAAIAVPLLLHLLHRSERERISFPALRYLLRTEQEHSRRIRMRQWLLLALRILVLLLFALAAAQAVLRGEGAAHPPTGVVLLIDNSMSSARVVGEGRVLDTLEARALATLELAGPGDRFWVMRAGAPWEPVTPLSAEEAVARVSATEVSAAAGDLNRSLERAGEIVARSGAERGEIHLLSDLQATAWGAGPEPSELPVVIWSGSSTDTVENGWVQNVVVGGGLAPRAGRRTEFAVTLGGVPDDPGENPDDARERSVRLILEDQLRGAVRTLPGRTAVLAVGPFGAGPLEGVVEADPDDLRIDDAFHLRIDVVPPPSVALLGDPGPFVRDALEVLVDSDRIVRGDPATADVLIAAGGALPAELDDDRRLVVLPPLDRAVRPGLSRRLGELELPVVLDPESPGETRIATDDTGAGLEGTLTREIGAVRLTGPGRRRVTLEDGGSWLVDVPTPGGGRAAILASPLLPERTDVPISAGMVPLLEWLLGPAAPTGVSGGRAGDTLRLASRATEVERPDGTRLPVDGTLEFRSTDQVGIYTVLAGDSVLDRIALNAPPRESLLRPIDADRLVDALGDGAVHVDTPARWARRVFVERQGRDIWRPLLLAALVLLLVESWIASSGGAARSPTPASSQARVHDP